MKRFATGILLLIVAAACTKTREGASEIPADTETVVYAFLAAVDQGDNAAAAGYLLDISESDYAAPRGFLSYADPDGRMQADGAIDFVRGATAGSDRREITETGKTTIPGDEGNAVEVNVRVVFYGGGTVKAVLDFALQQYGGRYGIASFNQTR